ncbi:MAG TPA: APC family permease [Actinophytocola sp.]|uniref:APC family permease n=1 Tax=Actinophytocola sp. TaxID=1872138 RepID=UPI002DDD86FB|nr:APC family permease [Actinophytocola sp.]HEV2783205.1 APC family permease [Actinophytocola sp.]
MSYPRQAQSNLSMALAEDRLGVPSVLFFVMSAATPLTVVAGVVTTGFAATGLIGIPLAFLVIGVLLGLFSVGYVAMARHVVNAGAFYAYISQGLSRPLGVGCSWVAVVAYSSLQVGLYGLIGSAAAPLLSDWFGVDVKWWVIALVAWAIVGALGVQQVDLNGKVLAVLLVTEVAVIVLFSLADLGNPAGGTVTFDTLAPGNLFGDGLGALLAIGVLGFIGFECSVVFSEEARDPKRTVCTATYLSVALIAGLYAFASWAMSVATGPENVVGRSQAEGPETVFNLAGAHLGAWAVDLGHALLVTSVLAAMISFHNTTARYMFALGRERVLPSALGRTSNRTGSPVVGSIIQSVVGLVVIVAYASGGWDPVLQLFFWGGAIGGMGILALITLTSVAVLVFFGRNPYDEPAWRRAVAPAMASIALVAVLVLVIDNFATLLAVAEDSPLRWGVPIFYAVTILAGVVWGLVLRARRPEIYATIGLGARSVTVTAASGAHEATMGGR